MKNSLTVTFFLLMMLLTNQTQAVLPNITSAGKITLDQFSAEQLRFNTRKQ
jgi:hypothetical protein